MTAHPNPQLSARLYAALFQLEAWLESQRQPGGYGGPVAHWWRDCLAYTGPGLDWRYEGILLGYLDLWVASNDHAWLEKARRTGDDLLGGQLPSGNFRNSAFENNPNTGGTPHEAAADLGLLSLASVLRQLGDPAWEAYALAAERNLQDFYISRLWDPAAGSFRDHPAVAGFVPNKSATLVEAFFAHAHLRQDDHLLSQYAFPTLESVLAHQVQGGTLDGAICQNSFGAGSNLRKVQKFFPYYIARCLPALLEAWRFTGEDRFAAAVLSAAGFILGQRQPDGSFPHVVYPRGHVNRYPAWIAALGDILRALDAVAAVGFQYDPVPTLVYLLDAQRPDGAFPTAFGFGLATPGAPHPDARDSLPVTGWNDKTFRYLAGLNKSKIHG